MNKALIYFMLFIGLVACERYQAPELEPSTDPIFLVNAQISGAPFNIAANGQYQASSGFQEDTFGVQFYYGSMGSCVTCPQAFEFRWRDVSSENPDIYSTIADDNLMIRSAQKMDSTILYKLSLFAMPQGSVSSYNWTALGNSYSSAELELDVAYDETVTRFPVTLEVTYENGCSASMRDTVYLPHHGCNCEISTQQLDSALYTFRGRGEGGNNYAYLWRFETGEEVPSKDVVYQLSELPNDGVMSLSLEAYTGNCKATRNYNQFVPEANTGCAINFDYSVTSEAQSPNVGDQLALGEVEIIYTNDEGRQYTSYLAEQDASSFVRILETTEYFDAFQNDDERSIKVEAEFNCWVSDGIDRIRITDGIFVLPIGKGAVQ